MPGRGRPLLARTDGVIPGVLSHDHLLFQPVPRGLRQVVKPVRRPVAYLYLILAMVLWSAALVIARGVHEIAPPFALTFWRWLGAAIVLLPFVLPRLRRELAETAESRRRVAGLCALMVVATTLSIVAVSYTTAIDATVINATQPAVTALVALAVLAERLSWVQVAGVVAAFAGILVMVFQADFDALLRLSINSGDLIMFAAVCFWSCYAVALHGSGTLPSLAVLLFLISASGAVAVLPFYVAEALLGRQFVVSLQSVSAAIYLSLGATLIAIYFWSAAIRSVGANRAAVFLNLIPVFGAALAVGFLGERLFAYHLAGAGLVIAGIFLVVRPSRERPRDG